MRPSPITAPPHLADHIGQAVQAELIALAIECARERLPVAGARVVIGQYSYAVLVDKDEVRVFGKPGWWLASY